jgi:hypothetical protein
MDLRAQLHDAMWVRVLFTLALLTGALWVQIDHHGVVLGEVLVGVAVVALVNLPMYIVERRLSARAAATVMVITDLALVTAAIIYSGGALSAEGIFYVWPIVFSAVFLPAWAPYAVAGVASAAYIAVWELQHLSVLAVSATVAEIHVPPNWMLITVFLHVAAFMLVALLSGRLAQALIGSSAELSGAKADTEEQLRRMKATNEQLRIMGESSRTFLRHQDVTGLMPDALVQIAGATGVRRGFALILNHNSGDFEERGMVGDVNLEEVRRYKELGIVEVATAGRSGACSRPWRRMATTASWSPLSRPSTRCSAWSACCIAPARPCRSRRWPPCAPSAARWRSSCATSSSTRSWHARTRSSRTSTSSRATSWPP